MGKNCPRKKIQKAKLSKKASFPEVASPEYIMENETYGIYANNGFIMGEVAKYRIMNACPSCPLIYFCFLAGHFLEKVKRKIYDKEGNF